MKKLKMIVTSVIVLAIVGSAFAFKAKIATFCILTTTNAGDDCTTFIQNRKIVSGTATVKYAPFSLWDGTETACTANGVNNNLCTAGPVALGTND